ncbi:nucleoside triphosphate pyrophosphatase [uncultured Tistrella sp.]|uniref:Maf family protein n=1 Tax=Tistrella mobilis TaxID=171437 RepID=UPI000C0A2D15|nr:Maf family nucleotide pyrophosphatase [uncultured Tistrella sp.]MAM73630.1 septum formation protein Maf [Tistrella sp.]
MTPVSIRDDADTAAEPRLILASQSAARAQLLKGAGLDFLALPARIDETAVKEAMAAEGAPAEDVAVMLAEMKARRISGRAGRVPVLGCDQMLVADGRWFDKPADRDEARATLEALSGRRHELISAAVVTIDGTRVWHAIGHARLTMRPLSPAFIDQYLDRAGEAVLGSVGAYQLEGLGAQLFSKVEGDYFTILGLPLIELLDFLRLRGVIPS